MFELLIFVFDIEPRYPRFETGHTKTFLEECVEVDCMFDLVVCGCSRLPWVCAREQDERLDGEGGAEALRAGHDETVIEIVLLEETPLIGEFRRNLHRWEATDWRTR
ncbi:hypothetical protein [Natronolimnobius baerhuensis]|uniref:hypothetical protein n=1 Tax=Natronolimnobius baerhuensis TaxID=253108 RepID=UPI0006D1EA32|nr:hypothetical protein [Natronolimnobius baerhuensis]